MEFVMANQRKTRFNSIDLLIIILLIGCAVALIMRFQLIDTIKSASGGQKAQISFYLSDIRETSEDYFADGDKFFVAGTNDDFGTLKSGFVFTPAEVFVETVDGKYNKSSSVTGRSDMRASVIASGTFSDEGFLLNNTKYIAAGSTLSISSDKIEVTVLITDITPVNE